MNIYPVQSCAPSPLETTAEVTVDFMKEAGPVKPVNGVGQPPMLGFGGNSLFHYLTEAGIPFSRLHDTGGAFGRNLYVDIPNLFRDFNADENDSANYDFTFTTPEIVDHYVAPALDEQSKRAHALGKYIATHTDGDNTRLLDIYMKSGFDIADSICPAPMTRVTLKETLDAFKGTKTIWGGIPSISVLKSSMSDREFYKLVDDTMELIGKGDHFIVSVADTLPPAAEFDRLMHLKKICEEFGPVK